MRLSPTTAKCNRDQGEPGHCEAGKPSRRLRDNAATHVTTTGPATAAGVKIWTPVPSVSPMPAAMPARMATTHNTTRPTASRMAVSRAAMTFAIFARVDMKG